MNFPPPNSVLPPPSSIIVHEDGTEERGPYPIGLDDTYLAAAKSMFRNTPDEMTIRIHRIVYPDERCIDWMLQSSVLYIVCYHTTTPCPKPYVCCVMESIHRFLHTPLVPGQERYVDYFVSTKSARVSPPELVFRPDPNW